MGLVLKMQRPFFEMHVGHRTDGGAASRFRFLQWQTFRAFPHPCQGQTPKDNPQGSRPDRTTARPCADEYDAKTRRESIRNSASSRIDIHLGPAILAQTALDLSARSGKPIQVSPHCMPCSGDYSNLLSVSRSLLFAPREHTVRPIQGAAASLSFTPKIILTRAVCARGPLPLTARLARHAGAATRKNRTPVHADITSAQRPRT